MFSRREWMRAAGSAAIAAVAGVSAKPAKRAVSAQIEGLRNTARQQPSLCFFSKHLPDLAWNDLGKAVKETGFDGVDLTVRAGGHVLPARAADDLPRALDAIRSHGVAVPMITTELTAVNALAKPLLTTAARHGVRYFKTGYWRYSASADVRAQIASAAQALADLAVLARDCGIEMGFHNHAGYIGGALWDIAPAIDKLDATWAGYYFDPRHAVAEGGAGAWKAATHLVAPRLKMIALKDFFWEKSDKGWRIRDCPLGEGMVDWKWFGSALRDAHFAGPVSLHFEYEIAGTTPAERTRNTLDAARRDLAIAKTVIT